MGDLGDRILCVDNKFLFSNVTPYGQTTTEDSVYYRYDKDSGKLIVARWSDDIGQYNILRAILARTRYGVDDIDFSKYNTLTINMKMWKQTSSDTYLITIYCAGNIVYESVISTDNYLIFYINKTIDISHINSTGTFYIRLEAGPGKDTTRLKRYEIYELELK